MEQKVSQEPGVKMGNTKNGGISVATATAHWKVILLDKAKQRPRRFASLQPEVVSSSSRIDAYVERAPANSLWISYAKDLTAALIRSFSLVRHFRPLGSALSAVPAGSRNAAHADRVFQAAGF